MDLTQLVIQHLPAKRKKSATGIYINCPMCRQMGESRNDTKFRGGFTVQPDKGFIYHCYNCQFATMWRWRGRVSKNLMKFLTTLGIPSTQIPIGLRLLREDETFGASVKYEGPDVAIDFDEVKLPIGAKTIEEWANENNPPSRYIEAITYLHSRGEPVFNGWIYYWSDSNKFSMDQRIIIPFYHHGKIVGYTARCFTNRESLSKYYGKTPADYMFNQDKLENDKPRVILVEGIFDAIAIKGIAALGNKLSPKQVNLLNTCKKEVILVPDRNRAGEQLLEQALENDWSISVPEWDSGIDDCAAATKKYGRIYVLESIFNSITRNPAMARMKFGASRL